MKELESLIKGNDNLKSQLNDSVSIVKSYELKEEGTTLQVKQLSEKLDASKRNGEKLNIKCKTVKEEKELL